MSSSPTAASPSSSAGRAVADRPEAMVAELRRLVGRNAARWKGLALLEAAALAVAVPLAYLWGVFLLDNTLHLPVAGRLAAAAGLLVAVGLLGARLAGRLRALRLSEDEVALAIERQTAGGVQNRLINALQLARGAGTGQVAAAPAVVRENYDALRQTVLPAAVASRRALGRAAVAALLLGAGVAFWALRPAHFANAAGRIFLPLADIEPLYRTRIDVEPGDVEAEGDVTIRLRVRGERPQTITVTRRVQGQRLREAVALPQGSDEVAYTFAGVRHSLTYTVSGGDFSSRVFRIDVPTRPHLSLVRATLHYPAYTGRAPASTDQAGGDLEALRGTRAELAFLFDRPADGAALLVERARSRDGGGERTVTDRVELAAAGSSEFRGELSFEDAVGYEIELRQGDRAPQRLGPFAVRVLADQNPKAELAGLDPQAELAPDAALTLTVRATDDLGLAKAGLFARRGGEAGEWREIVAWPAEGATEFARRHELLLASLGVTEGDVLELAAHAADADPAKKGAWVAGPAQKLLVGGEGAGLQRQYEQLLKSEADLKALIVAQDQAAEKTVAEMRKLDPASGLKGDDPKTVEAPHAAAAALAKGQGALRETAGRIARDLPAQAGNLRIAVGMLADTEMVRAIRILEGVAGRDGPQAKHAALADARLTQERTARSLREMLEQLVALRHEWELSHMVGFVEMLAERQARLRDQSRRHAMTPPAEVLRASMQKRQVKVLELVKLAQPAFGGMAERVRSTEPTLADAFQDAAKALAAPPLHATLTAAAAAAAAGLWADAAAQQHQAARELAALFARLKKAQADAALKALEALKLKAQTDLEAQKALQKLQAGTDQTFLALKDQMKLEDILHMREVAAGKKGADQKPHVEDYLFPDAAVASLDTPDKGIRQQFDILKLAETPGQTPSFPKQSDRKANRLTNAPIQEKFDDLVGKLLEEADEINNKYETYNLNAAFNINEPGEVGKQGGDLNSTAAAAATGNQKPPTSNVGGASRAGRRGARAHGMVVGDESINRRGRDKVQEGQEKVGDQPGPPIQEKKSADVQKDTSTGVGGRKVEGDNEVKFSLEDAGQFTDDVARRMQKPQAKNFIVERKDGRVDPRVAEMLRDLTSRQEQLIERVKAIRKELRNLYLPTDHVDEALAQLQANLDALKEQPDPELFRAQAQALDQLRNAVRVFQGPASGFQPSVPRERVLHGRILDEPARAAPPGYEEAVKRYYEKLSAR